ncbi:hypothetical protein EPH_0051520 [Eimeria praecox]|uniref:Uncharacterized protein n=1 Tax=Eimeria praecox TaxID=51316 RepID=U6GNB5_9EIME|nr:hypothetical protein EPH_0051520 [Eimeria praecox]
MGGYYGAAIAFADDQEAGCICCSVCWFLQMFGCSLHWREEGGHVGRRLESGYGMGVGYWPGDGYFSCWVEAGGVGPRLVCQGGIGCFRIVLRYGACRAGSFLFVEWSKRMCVGLREGQQVGLVMSKD